MMISKMLTGLLLGNGLFSLILTGLVFSSGSFIGQWTQSFIASGSLLLLSLMFILPAAWMVGQLMSWSKTNDHENSAC